MNRIEMLKEVLQQNPTDAFARYGLAMEHAKAGEIEIAMTEFTTLLGHHPDYAPGFFMAAQTLARAGRTEEAKTYLQNGIAAAARTGNAHARGEMEAMLEDLSY